MMTLAQQSSPVDKVDFAFTLLFGFAFFMLFVLTACACWFLWRYYHKRHPVADNITGNWLAEGLWTVIPSLLIFGLFYYGWEGYKALRTVPDDAFEVSVTARMWSWSYTYPDGKESDILVVPVGEPVKLRIRSVDVIHSFFAPAFRIKMDAVPGMDTYAWFRGERTGDYDVFCAEYCGRMHATMSSIIRVVEKEEYAAWVADTQVAGADAGERIMQANGCFSCHSLDGSAGVGPSFKGMFGREVTVTEKGRQLTLTADVAYLTESIVDPAAKLVVGYENTMPPYQNLQDSQIAEILRFLAGLGNGVVGATATPAP